MKTVYWFEDTPETIDAECGISQNYRDENLPGNLAEYLDKEGWTLVPIFPDWQKADTVFCDSKNVLWLIDLYFTNVNDYAKTHSWAKAKLRNEENHLKTLKRTDCLLPWPHSVGLAVAKSAIMRNVEFMIVSAYGLPPWLQETFRFWGKHYGVRSIKRIDALPSTDSIAAIVKRIKWISGSKGLPQLTLKEWLEVKSINIPIGKRIPNGLDLEIKDFLEFQFHPHHMKCGSDDNPKVGSDIGRLYKGLASMPTVVLTKDGQNALKRCRYDAHLEVEGCVKDWTYPSFRALIDDDPPHNRNGDLKTLIECWKEDGSDSLVEEVNTVGIDSEYDFLWFNVSRALLGVNGLSEMTKDKDDSAQIVVRFDSVKESRYEGIILRIEETTKTSAIGQYNSWVPYKNDKAKLNTFYYNFVAHMFEAGAGWIFYSAGNGQECVGHFIFLDDNNNPARSGSIILGRRSDGSQTVTFLCFFPAMKAITVFRGDKNEVPVVHHQAEFQSTLARNIIEAYYEIGENYCNH